jgi:5-oxoprolinase (ATP-hydrolysing)
MNNFSFGGFNQKSYYETIGGGGGAGNGFNGESGV